MKQRAKVYKGKRVVMGDKNRVTKHEIHVNDIPQQGGESGGDNGGGGGSASGENDYEYIDVRELGELKTFLVIYALAVRIKGADYYTMPITSIISNIDNPDAVINETLGVMIDTSFMYDLGQDGKYTISEMCSLMGVDYASLPRITKEEFYTLN